MLRSRTSRPKKERPIDSGGARSSGYRLSGGGAGGAASREYREEHLADVGKKLLQKFYGEDSFPPVITHEKSGYPLFMVTKALVFLIKRDVDHRMIDEKNKLLSIDNLRFLPKGLGADSSSTFRVIANLYKTVSELPSLTSMDLSMIRGLCEIPGLIKLLECYKQISLLPMEHFSGIIGTIRKEVLANILDTVVRLTTPDDMSLMPPPFPPQLRRSARTYGDTEPRLRVIREAFISVLNFKDARMTREESSILENFLIEEPILKCAESSCCFQDKVSADMELEMMASTQRHYLQTAMGHREEADPSSTARAECNSVRRVRV